MTCGIRPGRLAAALPLAASIVLLAGCAAAGPAISSASPAAATPSPTAIPSPTATPVRVTASPATPSPAPTVKPTAAPSDAGSDGMPITVNLDNATNHKVYVDVVDQSGKVVSAVSGKPGDGASVAPGRIKVENVDPNTLRLTWTDTPGDNALSLYIDKSLTHFVLLQPEHEGDAIAFDRILILKFSQPVSVRNIEAILQTGSDNVG